MLTSRRFAPPRTCSSATSTAPCEVVRLDQPPEARRAGDVRPLADHHEAGVGADLERLEPAEPGLGLHFRDMSRGQSLGHVHDGPGVFGRRAAAAADEVQEPVPRELAQVGGSCPAQLVVAAELVRQARRSDGTRRTSARCCESSSTNGRISFAPSEQFTPTISGSACSTDVQNASTRLPGEVAAAEVDDRERDPERQLRRDLLRRRRSRPSRSACRRSSRRAAGRRRPRRAPRSAPRTPRARRRT